MGILLIALKVVFSVTSVVLNFLNVLVTCNKKFDFPISNRVAIVSMSMADLIIGLSVIWQVISARWGNLFCRAFLIITVTCARVSVVSLVIIIVDRYFCIAFPFRHQRYATRNISIAVAIATWLFTLIADVIESATGSYYYDQRHGVCQVAYSVTFFLVSSTLIYFIPLTIMAIVYTRLLLIVRRLARNMARIYPMYDIPTSPTNPAPSQEPTTSSCEVIRSVDTADLPNAPARAEGPDKDHKNTLKTIMTFFAVTVAFTLTNVPNRVVRLMVIMHGPRAVPQVAIILCRAIIITGSWWNFVIFSLLNSNFRGTIKTLFCCKSRLRYGEN